MIKDITNQYLDDIYFSERYKLEVRRERQIAPDIKISIRDVEIFNKKNHNERIHF